MVASAQIAYPANEEEEEMPESKGEDAGAPDEEELGSEDLERDEPDEACGLDEEDVEVRMNALDSDEGGPDDYVDRQSGRRFSVSPEEFCADPYAQYGELESRQALGKRGEDAAVRYLLSKGFEIIKRNWFCRFGEADIIAWDPQGSLCFIEVKTRKSIEAGFPEEAITRDKRRRYERIALAFMMVSDDWDDNTNVRFDAICICVTGPHRAMLRHHRGCFDAGV